MDLSIKKVVIEATFYANHQKRIILNALPVGPAVKRSWPLDIERVADSPVPEDLTKSHEEAVTIYNAL